jgi:hypothetical protein
MRGAYCDSLALVIQALPALSKAIPKGEPE